MLREQLKNLFSQYPTEIRQIIVEVLNLEQQNISMAKPRVKESIDEIISRIASQQIEQQSAANANN